ncbi:hypothetical protein H0H93_009290 [Arthromyces matolae]|nr:hypothetical protein H0H93_009290 [Arthromyces matolae]
MDRACVLLREHFLRISQALQAVYSILTAWRLLIYRYPGKREMLVDVTDKPSAGPQQTHHQRALQDDGMHWDTAKPGECAFYGVRRFTAPLLNSESIARFGLQD